MDDPDQLGEWAQLELAIAGLREAALKLASLADALSQNLTQKRLERLGAT